MSLFERPEKDARLKGFVFKSIPTGVSTVEYIFDFDCSFTGASVTSSVSSLGSSIRFETQYEAAPSVWLRYKKFADTWNLYPNYVCKTNLFPTNPKAGIKLLVTVNNQEGVPIDLGINLFLFATLESVKPTLGEQGSDW